MSDRFNVLERFSQRRWNAYIPGDSHKFDDCISRRQKVRIPISADDLAARFAVESGIPKSHIIGNAIRLLGSKMYQLSVADRLREYATEHASERRVGTDALISRLERHAIDLQLSASKSAMVMFAGAAVEYYVDHCRSNTGGSGRPRDPVKNPQV